MRLLLCLTLIALPLAAAEPDVGFPGLITHRFESGCFGPRSVHFDAKLASARDEFTEIADHPAGGFHTVLAGSLSPGGERYLVRYDDGPSCDPTFSLWKDGSDSPLGELGGDHLVLPGNGFLYVIRRSNRSFEGREKWQIRAGLLEEVSQSHYYVGISTTTRTAVTLKQNPASEAKALAQVPKGERVTVVVQQVVDGRDWYLVRTPFGLLGWTEDSGYGDDRQFEDIQFFGD